MSAIEPAGQSVTIPLWLQIKLEQYALEALYRSESYYNTEEEVDYRTFTDVVDDMGDEVGEVLSYGRRIVCKLPAHIGGSVSYIAKVVGRREQAKDEEIPVSTGFVQNWREILLSRYEPMREYIVPVVSASPTGLWLVMPYAEQETLEWDQDKIDVLAEQVEDLDGVKPVMRGAMGGGLDIYWTNNWGAYNGEYRLLDYGGIVLTDSVPRSPCEFPFSDPASPVDGSWR